MNNIYIFLDVDQFFFIYRISYAGIVYFKEVEKFMNLSFIMYKSEKPVEPVNFYFYNITVTQENGAYPVNKPETMRIIARSIVRKLCR